MLVQWLTLLENEAGQRGATLVHFFRTLPQVQLATSAAPGSIAQGGYTWTFGLPTLRLGLTALQAAQAEITQGGISHQEAERLIAGLIGHEIRHIERRDLAGSVLGEVDAWALTYELYQAMGVAELAEGQGWTDAAFHAHQLRGASAEEIRRSSFARQRYPGMPLYPGWRGWIHAVWLSWQGNHS